METLAQAVEKIDRKLFGELGNGGVIGELREADDENKRLIDERHQENRERFAAIENRVSNAKWLLIGFIAACCFFSGNGTFSMDHVARILGWLK